MSFGWCSMELDEGLNGLFMVVVGNEILGEVSTRFILDNGEVMLPWGEEDKSFKLQFQVLRVRFKGNGVEGISSQESKEGPLSLD
ncbi:hypothetical protein V6N11_072050 [Hibiscus sabdariffa]|uniref:Uncharacterized protein n=1 Tax=Hibiscus sabdariffa TaxID=183260 RepID=A0ABR2U2I1_9ROSI